MNVGQILETHLGWSCTELGEKLKKLINENQKRAEKSEKIRKNRLLWIHQTDAHQQAGSTASKALAAVSSNGFYPDES